MSSLKIVLGLDHAPVHPGLDPTAGSLGVVFGPNSGSKPLAGAVQRSGWARCGQCVGVRCARIFFPFGKPFLLWFWLGCRSRTQSGCHLFRGHGPCRLSGSTGTAASAVAIAHILALGTDGSCFASSALAAISLLRGFVGWGLSLRLGSSLLATSALAAVSIAASLIGNRRSSASDSVLSVRASALATISFGITGIFFSGATADTALGVSSHGIAALAAFARTAFVPAWTVALAGTTTVSQGFARPAAASPTAASIGFGFGVSSPSPALAPLLTNAVVFITIGWGSGSRSGSSLFDKAIDIGDRLVQVAGRSGHSRRRRYATKGTMKQAVFFLFLVVVFAAS